MKCGYCGGNFSRAAGTCLACGSPKTESAQAVFGGQNPQSTSRRDRVSEESKRLTHFVRGAGCFLIVCSSQAESTEQFLAAIILGLGLIIGPFFLKNLS